MEAQNRKNPEIIEKSLMITLMTSGFIGVLRSFLDFCSLSAYILFPMTGSNSRPLWLATPILRTTIYIRLSIFYVFNRITGEIKDALLAWLHFAPWKIWKNTVNGQVRPGSGALAWRLRPECGSVGAVFSAGFAASGADSPREEDTTKGLRNARNPRAWPSKRAADHAPTNADLASRHVRGPTRRRESLSFGSGGSR